jgi:YidC/Oxa1 family membrane protein insertase
MERNVLVAVFLSFLVLYAYQRLFIPSPSSAPEPVTTVVENAPEAAVPAPSPQTLAPTADGLSPNVLGAVTAPIAATPTLTEAAAREIVVDTGVVEAVLSNQGATISNWRLRDHLNDAGNPLDLVPGRIAPDQPTPFMLRVDEPSLTRRVNEAIYRVSGDFAGAVGGRVDATAESATLVFEFGDSAGLNVRKTFTFEPGSYVVTFSASVNDGERELNPAVAWGPGLSLAGASGGGGFFTNYNRPPEAIYFFDDDVERVSFDEIAEQPVYDGVFRFAGIDDHYFIAAALDTGSAQLEYAPVVLPAETGEPRQMVGATFLFASAPNGVQFFFGPKQFDLLRSIDPEFVRAIYFGIFALLVVPLLGALNWFHGFVGNYGWSIVLLTIGINLIIFPLRHKSIVSMRKMQALAPQLKAIQERYKGLKTGDPDKQKMTTETMKLYREKGVNPASGCLPMLLTMPVLFAFYSLLSAAIELRNAPFTLWIQDLSLPDPYYVTPLLMGVTMFWQQRITPSTADPTQQRIMMMMPLMFMVFFIWAPAGLVLYWFVSNLWMIGQQYFTNWLIGPPPIAVARPPAERQLKQAGEGSTKGSRKESS